MDTVVDAVTREGPADMSAARSEAPEVPALKPLDMVRFGVWMMTKSPGEAIGRLQDKYGAPAIRTRWNSILPMPGVLVADGVMSADPAFTEAVALNQDDALSNEYGWGTVLARLGMFERSILQMEFDEHRHDRLIMQQVMTPERLSGYFDDMAPKIGEAVRGCPTGEAVDLRKLFKRVNMTLVIQVFMGITLPPEEVYKVGKAFDDLVSVTPIRQAKARRYLSRFLHTWIPIKRAADTPDLMSRLCNATTLDGERYTDDQIMRHMAFFLFAAHDTTTITMTNMAYYLALNPKWQQRAREEAFRLPENVTRADVDKMPDLQNIMKETLRFRTPVLTLLRGAVKDTEILGYRIRKGTQINAFTWAHHTNPEVWSEPRRFDPDRFAPDRAEDKDHRGKWMPFGAGVHKCIGMHFAKMQVLTFYHTLLREFEWSVDPDYVLPTFRNSLIFSDGFPASVQRLDPVKAPMEKVIADEFTAVADQQVGWGVVPNLRPLTYLRSRRRQRDAASTVLDTA